MIKTIDQFFNGQIFKQNFLIGLIEKKQKSVDINTLYQ